MKIGKTSGRYYDREVISVTTLTTIPSPVSSGAETMTTEGIIFTVSDAAVPAKVGDWINASGEVRKIVEIISSTEGRLNESFTSDLSADTFGIIDGNDLARIWAIDFKPIGSSNTTIDGVDYSASDALRISIPSPDEAAIPNQIKPVIIDGTCKVIVHRLV